MLILFGLLGNQTIVGKTFEDSSAYQRLCLYPLWKGFHSEEYVNYPHEHRSLQIEAIQLSRMWENFWSVRRYEPPYEDPSQIVKEDKEVACNKYFDAQCVKRS